MHTYSRRLSFGMAALVLVLTVIFHLLVVDHPYGFAFAIYAACLVLALHVIVLAAGWQKNFWAYVFLIPVVLATTAEALYANPVVRTLGFAIVAASLAFFSYWIASPRIAFRQVQSLWPFSFLLETLFPVQGASGMITKESFGTKGSRVLLGVGIAIPFLIVIGALFVGADPLFGQFLSDVFHPTPFFVFKFMADIVVAIFLSRVAWAMVTRVLDSRQASRGEPRPASDQVILTTFLGLLNVLFLVFLIFQFIYFFGGESYIKNHGITYADYARSGFFQLLFVAGIVFGITWFVYRMSELRHPWVKILNIALIIETGVIITSAVKRLLLYMDAYGLSVSRFWAMTVILVIALVLLIAAVGAIAKANYASLAKMMFILLLWIFSGLLLVNVEGLVARINTDRFLSGKTDKLDIDYLMTLSSDAIPALATLQHRAWPTLPLLSSRCAETFAFGGVPVKDAHECLALRLKTDVDSLKTLGSLDWRNLVWSDYQAVAALP